MAKTRTCFLIDGHNLLYKAHYAFAREPLINSRGEDTSVVFGVTRMLNVLIKEHAPDYLAFVLDSPGPTFRSSLFSGYKASRPPMPEAISAALPLVINVVKAYGIAVFQRDGFEADDILATAARRLAADGFSVFIVTGDKDLCQVIDDNIRLLSSRKGLTDLEIIDHQAVVARYGVAPAQIPDLLALMGDSADDIPGVKGVGPKTAAALLQEFSSVEQLIEKHEQIAKPRFRDLIRDSAPLIKLSKLLAQVRFDVPILVDAAAVQIATASRQELKRIFHDMEFHQLARELSDQEQEAAHNYRLISGPAGLADLAGELRRAPAVSVTAKSSVAGVGRRHLLGLAFSWAPGLAAYCPIASSLSPEQTSSDRWDGLRLFLSDPDVVKITSDGKSLLHDLAANGVDLAGIQFDTALAAYLVNPSRKNYAVDVLALEHLRTRTVTEKELLAPLPKGATLADAPLEQLMEQACQEADYCLRLEPLLRGELDKLGLSSLYDAVEMPLVKILRDIEAEGIRIDVGFLRTLAAELGLALGGIEQRIFAIAGGEFNAKSPKQLNDVLFLQLKYPSAGLKKTQWGASTDEESLQSLLTGEPVRDEFIQLLLEHRNLSKIKGTYVDVLPSLVNPRTGRVHSSFNQMTVETGRLSSSDPNLQNIPARGEWGRKIRQCFISAPGFVLVSADYSQIELRVLAHMSQDPEMMRAFHEDKDIHAATAAKVFAVRLEDVSPEMRQIAKAVNFGIDYGMTAYGLSTRIGRSRKEAQQFIDEYFAKYPKVAEYIAETAAQAERDGYVTTLLGRRRYFHQIRAARRDVQEAEKRKAINMPIQGSAADIVKLAMIELQQFFHEHRSGTRMILQVHDELLFEVPEGEWPEREADIRRIMEQVAALAVPLKVSISAGQNWGDIH